LYTRQSVVRGLLPFAIVRLDHGQLTTTTDKIMRLQQLLEHHGIAVNPFAEEDAQSDPVFKERCRDATYHPAWDKVYGDPADPATSIVFGEKGSGKTAMRMQMAVTRSRKMAVCS
jgi:hypothetical protein